MACASHVSHSPKTSISPQPSPGCMEQDNAILSAQPAPNICFKLCRDRQEIHPSVQCFQKDARGSPGAAAALNMIGLATVVVVQLCGQGQEHA